MRFVSSDSIVLFMYFVNLKSGIGSCIAPKAGLARHPAKGMCRAGMFQHSGQRLPRTREQLGQPVYSTAKQRRRESKQPWFYWGRGGGASESLKPILGGVDTSKISGCFDILPNPKGSTSTSVIMFCLLVLTETTQHRIPHNGYSDPGRTISPTNNQKPVGHWLQL